MNKSQIKKVTFMLLVLSVESVLTGCATQEKKAVQAEQSRQIAEHRKPGEVAGILKKRIEKPVVVQTGRYSSVIAEPTKQQRQLLQVVISVKIPDRIETIRETIHYLLKRSGYQLREPMADQPELVELLSKKLPDVHRNIGPMTLEDALSILTTPSFVLKEDTVHRLIGYQLDARYVERKL